MLETNRMNELNNLVRQFEFNIDQYKGKSYDEAKTRADFIDKFFYNGPLNLDKELSLF